MLFSRRPAEPFSLTTALCDVIGAVSNYNSNALEQNLDALSASLHTQVLSGRHVYAACSCLTTLGICVVSTGKFPVCVPERYLLTAPDVPSEVRKSAVLPVHLSMLPISRFSNKVERSV